MGAWVKTTDDGRVNMDHVVAVTYRANGFGVSVWAEVVSGSKYQLDDRAFAAWRDSVDREAADV